MKTKTIFLWVLLAMLVGGVGNLWADTYELRMSTSDEERRNDGSYSTTLSFFNISNSGGSNTRFTGYYDGFNYERGLKVVSSTSISFTPNNTSIVTIVQCSTDNSNPSSATIKFDNETLAISSAVLAGTNCRVYTIRNVSANAHSITQGSGESGLFYIKVQETGALSGYDYTVKTYPYTWNFNTISDCESEFIGYSDWAGGSGNKPDANGVYVRQTPSDYSDSDYPMGYDITALKGLRFSKAGYIAPDCNINYIYVTSTPTITIPSVPAGSFVSVVGNSRDENTRTIAGTNTTPATQTSKDGPFVFKASSTGEVALELQSGDYNLHSIEVVEDDLERYSSLPYEWRFSDASWWVTKRDWLISPAWGIVSNIDGGNIRNAWGINTSTDNSLYLCNDIEIPETNGLSFKGTSGRVGLNVGNYLWLNVDASVKLPSLPAGAKIIVRARSHSGNSTLTPTNTEVLTAQEVTTSVRDYEFTVDQDGSVTFTNGTNSIRILNIKIEKTESSFSYRSITSGFSTTMTYDPTPRSFTVEGTFTPNVVGTGVTSTDFEVESSDPDIITTADNYYIAANSETNYKVSFINLKTGTKAGTAVVAFKFKGTNVYEASSFNVTFNIVKAEPTFRYTYYDKGQDSRTYDTSTPSNNTITKGMNLSTGITLATAGESDSEQKAHGIKFTSSNTEVATINQYTGIITFVRPGISIITAKFAGDDCYTPAETYFKLIVNGTEASSETLTWTTTSNDPVTPPSSGKIVRTLGDNSSITTYPATSSGSSTVKYMSSDNNVATVNEYGAVSVNHPGDARIYAYIDGKVESGTATSGVSIEYELQVNGGNIEMAFEHNTGTLTTGCSAMPRLIFPSGVEVEDITTLSLSIASGDDEYVSIPATLLTSEYLITKAESDGRIVIEKVYPIIRGIKATPANSPVRVTATFVSPYYNNGQAVTTYIDITVTDSRDLYSWKESKTEYTLVEGEFMMMPYITGNANGNIDGLSKGVVNQVRGGYLYDIKGASRTITYNSNDYYWGQGVPDYSLTPAAVGGGVAYIFNVNGGDSNHPALMIYGESAGDVVLRATDSQTGWSCGDITIHVVSKADRVTSEEANFWADKSFPFTWDFTKIARTSITDDVVHWKSARFSGSDPVGGESSTGRHYLGMATSLDYNYADEQDPSVLQAEAGTSGSSNPKAETIAKVFCNGEGNNCKIMPAFHGLRLALGNNSHGRYIHKTDKVSIYDTGVSDPRLYIEGGPQYLYLPELPSSRTPGTYKLFMKVKGHNLKYKNDDSSQGIDNGNTSHVSVDVLSAASGSSYSTTNIATESTLLASISSGNPEIKGFDISSANAGKTIRIKFDKNVDVYWIALSTEAKPVTQPENTTYPAATYSYPEALDIDKSEEANTGLTTYYASSFTEGNVVMTRISGKVESGTNSGLMLKLPAASVGSSTSCYMIADPKNTETYSAPERFTTNESNLLKSTGASGMTINRFGDNEGYTNFVLTNQYIDVDDNNPNFTPTGTEGGQNWGFVRVNGSINAPANMAYLVLGGRQGNIGTTIGESASRSMYGIVFEDDSELTGIKNLHDSKILADEDAWYTLQGVRVTTPSRGRMYIHKGKKVFLK